MGSGFTVIAWLALLATTQPSASEISYMNDREFSIPITLPDDPGERANLERLFLYVSSDGGKSWRREKTATPKHDSFTYLAPEDGVYWFSVQTEDKQKKLKPPDISAEPPALKVVVDTRKPSIRLTAERQGELVTVTWDIREENPDLSSFKLEYRMGDSPTWYGVAVTPPSLSGQHKLMVNNAAAVSVRLHMEDYAHNLGTALADAVEVATPVAQLVTRDPATPQGLSVPPVRPPAASAPPGPAVAAEEPKQKPIAKTWVPAPNATYSPAAAPSTTATASASKSKTVVGPLLRHTNQRRIALNYEAKTGPSGIGIVQLWMTRDEGRTWQKMAETVEAKPPFPIELPSDDGIYGFILVVRSKAGLGRPDPRPGDAPDVRVELDTTPPEGELTKVEADPRRKDMLFLMWKAQDKNLTQAPITLKWTDKPGGEWKVIAENLPNTGKHPWIMPEGLPYQVYLKMEIRDLAGNVSVAESEEPVVIDLQEPVVKVGEIVIEPQAQKQ